MRVVIVNAALFDIHVTVLRTAPGELQFVLSRRPIAVHHASVVGRMKADIGQGVRTEDLPEDTKVSCVQDGLDDDIEVLRQEGTDGGGNELLVYRVRPPASKLN